MYVIILAGIAIILFGISKLNESQTDQTFFNDPIGYTMKSIFENRIKPYQNIISAMAESYQLPERLIKAVIYTESSGQERADSGDSIGLMQVNYLWSQKHFGYKGTREELFNPAINIKQGCVVLKDAVDRFGLQKLDYVYAYYNDGPFASKNVNGIWVDSKGQPTVQNHVDNFLKKYSTLV